MALISHPLRTIPVATKPHGNIPNTPFAVATIAFLLGAVCALGFLMFSAGGFASCWWSTYQLGFFMASWAFFHWAEFAVTAGWNLEKCSVDCALTARPVFSLKPEFSAFLLDNGAQYHIANGTALVEYLLTLYFWPNSKLNKYASTVGENA